jgi:hypothetical protein
VSVAAAGDFLDVDARLSICISAMLAAAICGA